MTDRTPPYRSAFAPAEVRRIKIARRVIRGFLLPPPGDPWTRRPCPFDVVGDTRYAKPQSKVSGKAAHELEQQYNVAAWLQQLYNRHLAHEEVGEWEGRVPSKFDVQTRVDLHQLFVLVSARYKVLSLPMHDTASSETMRTSVFGHIEHDVYCPSFDFLSTAQQASLVRMAAKRHGE